MGTYVYVPTSKEGSGTIFPASTGTVSLPLSYTGYYSYRLAWNRGNAVTNPLARAGMNPHTHNLHTHNLHTHTHTHRTERYAIYNDHSTTMISSSLVAPYLLLSVVLCVPWTQAALQERCGDCFCAPGTNGTCPTDESGIVDTLDAATQR
jgi:hypothetical protein